MKMDCEEDSEETLPQSLPDSWQSDDDWLSQDNLQFHWNVQQFKAQQRKKSDANPTTGSRTTLKKKEDDDEDEGSSFSSSKHSTRDKENRAQQPNNTARKLSLSFSKDDSSDSDSQSSDEFLSICQKHRHLTSTSQSSSNDNKSLGKKLLNEKKTSLEEAELHDSSKDLQRTMRKVVQNLAAISPKKRKISSTTLRKIDKNGGKTIEAPVADPLYDSSVDKKQKLMERSRLSDRVEEVEEFEDFEEDKKKYEEGMMNSFKKRKPANTQSSKNLEESKYFQRQSLVPPTSPQDKSKLTRIHSLRGSFHSSPSPSTTSSTSPSSSSSSSSPSKNFTKQEDWILLKKKQINR